MTREEMILKVLALVEETSSVKLPELEEYKVNSDFDAIMQLRLVDDFKFDELDYVEFSINLEEEFGVDLYEEDLPLWCEAGITLDLLVNKLIDSMVKKGLAEK